MHFYYGRQAKIKIILLTSNPQHIYLGQKFILKKKIGFELAKVQLYFGPALMFQMLQHMSSLVCAQIYLLYKDSMLKFVTTI